MCREESDGADEKRSVPQLGSGSSELHSGLLLNTAPHACVLRTAVNERCVQTGLALRGESKTTESYVTKEDRKAWLVAGGLFFTLFLLMGSTVDCVGLFFTPILKEFGWSHSRTSLIFMVLSGGMGLSSPVVGSLLNRAGARAVMSLGMLAVATGFIIGSRANSLPPLLVAFALIGLGVGAAAFVLTQIVLSNWFEAAGAGVWSDFSPGRIWRGLRSAPCQPGRLQVRLA